LNANVSQSGQLVELLGSIRVVKAFGLEGEQLGPLSQDLQRHRSRRHERRAGQGAGEPDH